MASKPQESETVIGQRSTSGMMDPTTIVSAASVLLALSYYFRGDRETGIFVGLWAPTILGFASYFRERQLHDRFEGAMGREGTLMNRLERLVQSR